MFADLGFKDAEGELAKAEIVSAISRVVAAGGLTQSKVAKMTGVDQLTVSKLLRGRTTGFTIDRLFAILKALGQDVEISIKPSASESPDVGKVSVSFASAR